MDGNVQFRVQNRTNYDIGVTLTSGMQTVIRKDSFLPLSVNDILYIESTSLRRKPFSSGSLVPTTNDNKDLKLEDLGGFTDTYTVKHFSDEEILANLEKPNKAVKLWLDTIEDELELYAISEVAKRMDLPGSKLKLIQAKLPSIDMLDVEEEQ